MTYEAWRISYQSSEQAARAAYKECAQLRAKIEAMERQEPVAQVCVHKTGGNAGIAWSARPLNAFDSLPLLCDGDKLYLAPGAQSAPSTPEIWLPIPEKHPTFDLVDLRFSDDSVLCGCVPQSDGDYWWEGPSGEVFIDPKHTPVTHWRLAAAP